MTLIITGASCAGKSAVAAEMRSNYPSYIVADIDDATPPGAARGAWLKVRLAELLSGSQMPDVICGVVFPSDLVELQFELEQDAQYDHDWPRVVLLDPPTEALRARYLQRMDNEEGAILNEYAARRLRYQVRGYRRGVLMPTWDHSVEEIVQMVLWHVPTPH